MSSFELVSKYQPTGDQPEAIKQLKDGLLAGTPKQTLLGVTGSGKTFTVANVINEINRPTLILSHNNEFNKSVLEKNAFFFKNKSELVSLLSDDNLFSHKKKFVNNNLNKIKQIYDLIEGIDQSICKKLIADVKSSKIKVQVKINGNELRVDGKKKDDLQSVIKLIESSNIGIPIQFINFRD